MIVFLPATPGEVHENFVIGGLEVGEVGVTFRKGFQFGVVDDGNLAGVDRDDFVLLVEAYPPCSLTQEEKEKRERGTFEVLGLPLPLGILLDKET